SIAGLYNVTSLQDLYNLTFLSPSPIKLAHTDPRLSNSGFCTIIMELAVAAGKNSSDLIYDDLLNTTVQSWIGQFESVAVQYGKSTGYLLQSMLQSGPAGITTSILYENLIIESAAEARARWNDKIIAVYPREGSIHCDHPFCILDGAPWVDDHLKEISMRFLEFIRQENVLQLATKEGFRIYSNNVTLPGDTFNLDNGVLYDISGCPQMQVPRDPVFISRVSDLWLMNRPAY
nr:substrate-binding domain-containing protein [Candidatus Sigynarchaeota archaeon]